MAPATSLARLRKQVLDLVASKRMKVREPVGSSGSPRAVTTSSERGTCSTGRRGSFPNRGRPSEPTAGSRLHSSTRSSPTPWSTPVRDRAPSPRPSPCPGSALAGLPRRGLQRLAPGGARQALGAPRRRRSPGRRARRSGHRAGAQRHPVEEVLHRRIGSDVLGEQVFFDTICDGCPSAGSTRTAPDRGRASCGGVPATVDPHDRRSREGVHAARQTWRSSGSWSSDPKTWQASSARVRLG